MTSRLRYLAVLLATAALCGLVWSGTHAHADGDEHAICWLCVSSFATLALPAIAGVFIVFWTLLAWVTTPGVSIRTPARHFALLPRAPPVLLPD
jgi:hypothetical protein